LQIVPWGRIRSWSCTTCGQCCQLQVQLTTSEWLNLTRKYGYNIASQQTEGIFISKTIDGWCPFLFREGQCSCGLQKTKPLACRLWPFRISDYPRYGMREESCFYHRGRVFYVYGIPFCRGFRYGTPTEYFTKNVLPEFIDIRLGLQPSQIFTTARF